MTLADHTSGGAAASTIPEDRDVITVENKISFLRPASSPELICRAEVLRTGKNLVFVEAEVMVDGVNGRVIVAKASSTLAVIPRSAYGVPSHHAGNAGGDTMEGFERWNVAK